MVKAAAGREGRGWCGEGKAQPAVFGGQGGGAGKG